MGQQGSHELKKPVKDYILDDGKSKDEKIWSVVALPPSLRF